MIHLDSDIPLGYDDRTLETIQASGGGVVGNLNEALMRIALSQADEGGFQDVVDGYVWSVVPTDQAVLNPSANEAGFAAIAARRLILTAQIQQNRDQLIGVGSTSQIGTLRSASRSGNGIWNCDPVFVDDRFSE